MERTIRVLHLPKEVSIFAVAFRLVRLKPNYNEFAFAKWRKRESMEEKKHGPIGNGKQWQIEKVQRKKSLKFFAIRNSSAKKPGPSWHIYYGQVWCICVYASKKNGNHLISGILNISLKYISICLSDERDLERVWKNFLMKSFKNWPHTVRPPCELTAIATRSHFGGIEDCRLEWIWWKSIFLFVSIAL